MFYFEPCVNFLKYHDWRSYIYAPAGGFEISNLIHGRIWNIMQTSMLYMFGESVSSMRLLSYLSGIGVLIMTWLVSRQLFDDNEEWIAWWSVAILALSHSFIFASHFGRPDIMVALFILCAVYLHLRGNYFWAGLTAALTMDVHVSGAVAMFSLIGLEVRKTHELKFIPLASHSRRWFSLFGGMAFGVSWWVFWHVLNNYELFKIQYSFLRSVSYGNTLNLSGEIGRWISFFWEGAYHRNLLWLGLIVTSIAYLKVTKQQGYKELIALFFGSLLGYIVAAPHKTTWYVIYIFPFIIMLIVKTLSGREPPLFKQFLHIGLVIFLLMESIALIPFYKANYDNFAHSLSSKIPKRNVVIFCSETYWLGLKNNFQIVGAGKINLVRRGRENFDLTKTLTDNKVEYIIADRELLGFYGDSLEKYISQSAEEIGIVEDEFYGSSEFLAKKSKSVLISKILATKGE